MSRTRYKRGKATVRRLVTGIAVMGALKNVTPGRNRPSSSKESTIGQGTETPGEENGLRIEKSTIQGGTADITGEKGLTAR